MPGFLIKIYDLITKYYLKYTNLYTRKKVKKLCMYLLTYAKRKKWRMNKPETNELSYLTVQFSCSVMSDSLQPHGLWHARLPCPSPTPRAYSNSCPLSWWCHPSISSSVFPFSFYLQSLPASGSFPMSQFFALGGQSIGSFSFSSVLPMSIQDWFALGWTGWIFLHSKGLSRVSSKTTSKVSILRHSAFFIVQLSHPYMTTGKT